jgi:membrane-anchored protein YejM (alkaline phosphatase superfamily)
MSQIKNSYNCFKASCSASFKLTFLITLATVPLFIFYLTKAAKPQSWREILYVIGSIGYFTSFTLILPVIFLPFIFNRYTRFIFNIFLWIIILFLVVDTVIFSIYTYHIDPTILRLILLDFSGLGIPTSLIVVFAFLALALLVALFFLQRLFQRKTASKRQVKIYLGVFLLSLGLFSISSVIHIWAANYSREEITIYDGFLPLYHPFTSHKLAPQLSNWLPSLFPPEMGAALFSRSYSEINSVNHHAVSLNFDSNPENLPKLILIIVLESWQNAALTEEISPNMLKFANQATYFTNHVSSGSVTVSGLFGLLYGTHPTLYDQVKNAPFSNPSVFTEALNNQGFVGRVFTGNNLERYQLKSLLFSRIAAENYYTGPDESLIASFLDSLDQETERRFDFLFLISSHLPYSSPEEFKKFKPTPAISGAFVFNNDTDPKPYLNSYYNSLYYLDFLVGQILNKLKEKNLYNDAWIVITGDHAEEFNENGLGFWGHGSNFSRWQTGTPMIIKRPHQTQGEVIKNRSLHQDLVPTLMELALGCLTPAAEYSNGQNIFNIPENRSTIATSYFDTAYINGNYVIELLKMKRYAWDDMRPLKKSEEESFLLRDMLSKENPYMSNK